MVRVLTDEQINTVCNRYIAGEDTTMLAKDYPVTNFAIIGLLKRRNIPRRSPSECHQKYKFNKYFFDEIDTEEKAYWLGFIYADGCNTGGTLCIRLANTDGRHLAKFKKSLDSEHPLYFRKRGEEHWDDQIEIRVKNKHFVDALNNLGVVPRKGAILTFPDVPNVLPHKLVRHFIRGYFDGDGCAYVSPKGYGRAFFVGTLPFLSDVNFFIGIHGKKINQGQNTYILRYAGKYQFGWLYDFFYEDATVYLERKMEKFELALFGQFDND